MSKTKNIIWIFGDQHRAQATGYSGDPNARTPNLDRMASEGLNFVNAVSGNPWCTPFRGCLMTGLYSHLSTQRTPQVLDPSIPVVTDVFNENGYRTAYFGKWHLSGSNSSHFVPKEMRGRFQTWIGYENNNAQYDCYVHGHDENGRDDTDPKAEKLPKYETDSLTDYLIDFLRQDHDKPFFTVLSVQPPHDPFVAPPEYHEHYDPEKTVLRPNVPDIPRVKDLAKKSLAGYYAQIENLDWNVGRVFETLKKTGLDKNTAVFFFSDHGEMNGSHGYVRKSSPWEESVCIPFLVKTPEGHTEQCKAPMNHVDIAPTSLGLCGLDIPEAMQGTDFSHYLDPERPKPENEPTSAYLQHVFRKRFQCLNRVWRGVRTIDGWKYISLEGQPWGLFDLNEDPYEMNNLAFHDTHNEKREELQSLLAEWIEKTGDSFELPEL